MARTMTKQRDDVTDPGGPGVLSYEAQTDDPEIRAMLENIDTNRAPPPVQTPVTDGELAAAYAAGDRTPLPGTETPPPQPAVLVERDPTLRMKVPLAVSKPAPSVTVRIDRRHPPLLRRRAYLAIGAAFGAAVTAALLVGINIVAAHHVTVPMPDPTDSKGQAPVPVRADPTGSQRSGGPVTSASVEASPPPSEPKPRPAVRPVRRPAPTGSTPPHDIPHAELLQ